MKISITYPVEGVTAIRIDNVLTDVLSQIGGFDYALSYLIDETVLIDTGFSWARKAMRKALMELGADKTIKVVVNTHYHEDHIGNNDLLLEMCAPKFYAHPLAITEIRFPHEPAWYRGFLFGPTGIQDVEPAPRVIRTKRFRLELHHLPGHCPGHLCVFEPNQRWLFSGDLYIAPDLDSQLSDANGPAWIASLDKAIKMAPRCMFDAHGTMLLVASEVSDLLVRKRDFLVGLRTRILLVADHAQSLAEVTRKVFHEGNLVNQLSFSDGWLSILTGADFSRANLVRSFLREAVHHELETTACPAEVDAL